MSKFRYLAWNIGGTPGVANQPKVFALRGPTQNPSCVRCKHHTPPTGGAWGLLLYKWASVFLYIPGVCQCGFFVFPPTRREWKERWLGRYWFFGMGLVWWGGGGDVFFLNTPPSPKKKKLTGRGFCGGVREDLTHCHNFGSGEDSCASPASFSPTPPFFKYLSWVAISCALVFGAREKWLEGV